MKSCIYSPALLKPGMIISAYRKIEGQKFKAIVSYVVSSRPAGATCHPVLKKHFFFNETIALLDRSSQIESGTWQNPLLGLRGNKGILLT